MSSTDESTKADAATEVTHVAATNEDVGVGSAGHRAPAPTSDHRQPDLTDQGLWSRTPPSRIEDYAIIALDFEDTLLGFGVKVVRTVGSVTRALKMIDERAPDFALDKAVQAFRNGAHR